MLLSSTKLSDAMYLPDAPQILEKIFRKFSGIPNFVLKNEMHSAFDIREESAAPWLRHIACSVFTWYTHKQ